jgi:hypothetical protein
LNNGSTYKKRKGKGKYIQGINSIKEGPEYKAQKDKITLMGLKQQNKTMYFYYLISFVIFINKECVLHFG